MCVSSQKNIGRQKEIDKMPAEIRIHWKTIAHSDQSLTQNGIFVQEMMKFFEI